MPVVEVPLVEIPLVEVKPVEIQKPVVPTKVFTDDQLQRYMDISVRKNVDQRIADHKDIVRRELAKYRSTNQ